MQQERLCSLGKTTAYRRQTTATMDEYQIFGLAFASICQGLSLNRYSDCLRRKDRHQTIKENARALPR